MATSLQDFRDMRDNHPNDELAAKTWLEGRLLKAKIEGVQRSC
jgi:hypothetical protein